MDGVSRYCKIDVPPSESGLRKDTSCALEFIDVPRALEQIVQGVRSQSGADVILSYWFKQLGRSTTKRYCGQSGTLVVSPSEACMYDLQLDQNSPTIQGCWFQFGNPIRIQTAWLDRSLANGQLPSEWNSASFPCRTVLLFKDDVHKYPVRYLHLCQEYYPFKTW